MSRNCRIFSPWLALGLCLSVAQAKPETSSALGITFRAPQGFNEAPKDTPGAPDGDVVQCYLHPPIQKQTLGTVIALRRLTPGDAAPPKVGVNGVSEVMEESSKSGKIAVGKVPLTLQGVECFRLIAHVNSKPDAAEISVCGPAANPLRLHSIMKLVLMSMELQTSMTGASAPSAAPSSAPPHSAAPPSSSAPTPAAPPHKSPAPATPAPEGRTLTAEERGERFGTGIAKLAIFIFVIAFGVTKLMKRKKAAQ